MATAACHDRHSHHASAGGSRSAGVVSRGAGRTRACSVPAAIGFIAVFGIAMLDGVVLRSRFSSALSSVETSRSTKATFLRGRNSFAFVQKSQPGWE